MEFPKRVQRLRSGLLLGAAFALAALPGQAEMRPTLSFSGVTGLIDMPTGESQSDGVLSITTAHFGPVSRTTLSFQITPRLSGSFRYMGIRNWDDVIANPYETYYDRSFDLRYQILDETRYLPSVTIGLQDFIGTGMMQAEYIAATKTFGDKLKVTAGLGWGRLGSYQSIGSAGTRPPVVIGEGGTAHTGQWFKGDIAPFAGIEWQITPKLGFKAEYSSDAYEIESEEYGTFERASPYNFGLEYQATDVLRLGAYYLYGSEFGVSAQFVLDPYKRPTGGPLIPGPRPVKERPARGGEAWSEAWVTDGSKQASYRDGLARALRADRVTLETVAFTANSAEVRIRVPAQENAAQVIGRTARAMANTLPASVETFRIVPLRNGIALSRVEMRRSDLEDLDHAAGQDGLMWSRVSVGDAADPQAGALMSPGLYPRFNWGVTPYVRTSLYDPDNPLRADVGVRLSASYDIAPGIVLSGAVSKKIAGNLDSSDRVSDSVLPHVRSDGNLYDREGDPAIEHLTAAWYARPADNLYSRVTVGYLERMFGGVSAELLWKRVDSPFALGVEINYVKQRDYDQMFGFRDYDVVTGHISGYYSFGKGYTAQLDVGRYLAGDYGATLSLDREFANGWSVGAFATFTDVSFEDFGEGSFDKGIRLRIPFNWMLGRPTDKVYSPTIRPITRDGGARLSVDGRLYDSVRGYDQGSLDDMWGRFWR